MNEVNMGKIIVAIDSFKGCLTSIEANRAAIEGILARMPEAEVLPIPVSDGGEGWLEAFRSPTLTLPSREGSPTPTLPSREGALVEVDVRDPLMRHIIAPYLVMGDTAVIEMAKASGLMLLHEEERNPMIATSYGTGQLVGNQLRHRSTCGRCHSPRVQTYYRWTWRKCDERLRDRNAPCHHRQLCQARIMG